MGTASLEAFAEFEAWLQARGAELHDVHVRPCMECPYWGCGVYTAEEGAGMDVGVLCRMPLESLALSVECCLADPLVGDLLGQLLADGEIDGRLCLMLYLVLQQAQGPRSTWAPYMAVLPRVCPVPLCWSADELQGLHGTPLLEATLSKRRQLQTMWGALVEPLLAAMFACANVAMAPSPSAWVWAYCTVWSRLLEWPATQDATVMHEGLLPFIDCCNHAFSSPVTRIVEEGSMLLVSAAPLPPSTQVCFSYGDKSNEMLLFLYGFALPANPHNCLLLHVPPPRLRNLLALEARLALLHIKGLSLRWLLPDPSTALVAETAWQEALAAASILNMPSEDAIRAASDEGAIETEDGHGSPNKTASERSGMTKAVQFMHELLETRLQELDPDQSETSREKLQDEHENWESFVGQATWNRDAQRQGEDEETTSKDEEERCSKERGKCCEIYCKGERELCLAYLEKGVGINTDG